jgi:outer membrane cobalamin receptor
LSAFISGDVSNVPPTDIARFLKPAGFDFNGDGTPEYNHGGDRSLEPSGISSVSGAVRLGRQRYNLTMTGRICRITDMIIWQHYEGAMGGLYQSEARDTDLYALTVHGEASPFGQLAVSSDYTYARLTDRHTEDNLSLMPRHNLYGVISWKQHISGLRLDMFPSLEAEYHSESYRSHFNTVDLEPYLLMHGRFSVKIKSFTFYYTMENIFNKTYETVYGYPSFRSVWWGIRWIFVN